MGPAVPGAALDDAEVALLVSVVVSAPPRIRNPQPRKPRRRRRRAVALLLAVAVVASVSRFANAGYDEYRDSHGGDFTALAVGSETSPALTLADTLCARRVDLVYLDRRVASLEGRSCADAGGPC